MKQKNKVAILQCDDVLGKFQTRFGNYPEMVQRLIKRIRPSLSYEVFDVRDGEYPNNIDEYCLFITTGSRQSVYEEDQWIERFVSFMGELYACHKNLFGICFGHQAIAAALGSKVLKSDKGWGVGVAENAIMSSGLLKLPSKKLRLLVSHQDQVMDLPGSAQVLARTDFCPNFAVLWGEHCISVQGHPEWEKEYSAALMNDRRDRIGHKTIEKGIESLSTDVDSDSFTRAVLDYLLGSEPV